MDYILLRFIGGFDAYQEIENNVCRRYRDLSGDILFEVPPEGDGGTIIDEAPPRQDWML